MAWKKRTTPNKKKPDTKSKIRLLREELETGTVLCIDPSIGSSSSSCGYALFLQGELTECGTLEVNISGNHSQRLNELTSSLRKEFTQPDVLLIEQITLWKGGRSATALVLNRVIGAVLSVWSLERVVEIPPPLWHSYTERVKYEKSDSNDAIMLGICAMEICNEIREEDGLELLPRKYRAAKTTRKRKARKTKKTKKMGRK